MHQACQVSFSFPPKEQVAICFHKSKVTGSGGDDHQFAQASFVRSPDYLPFTEH